MIRVRFVLLGFIMMLALPVCGYSKDRHSPLRMKARYAKLQSNIEMDLVAHGISPETYTITRVENPHILVIPNGPIDSFRADIDSQPKVFIRDPKLPVWMYYRTWLPSWRTNEFPSLHIRQVASNRYSVDIDKYRPSFGNIRQTFKHIGEVVSHLVTRRATNQDDVARELARQRQLASR
jgi:hypothetical protein